MKRICVQFLRFVLVILFAQVSSPNMLRGGEPVKWISCPDVPQRVYTVYHFNKKYPSIFKAETFLHACIYRCPLHALCQCHGRMQWSFVGDLFIQYVAL